LILASGATALGSVTSCDYLRSWLDTHANFKLTHLLFDA
jgi:hypothetical protein